MSNDLPPRLAAAVDAVIAATATGSLREATGAMSRHYRAGGTSIAGVDFAAYLASRLPATFAAVSRVLAELSARRPDFAPSSLLDAGSGPGTASWATAERWPDLAEVTLLDNSAAFLDVAKALAAAGGPPPLADARTVLGDLSTLNVEKADLVVAAYAFAELREAAAATAALSLWQAAKAALVIIEPGTPQGHARILKARTALVEAGAHITAPCPHAQACPLGPGDWCHFAVRLPRRRMHMQAKGAQVPFEDEKFSYVIATRTPAATSPRWARVLTPPRETKAEVQLKLCTHGGLASPSIARRDRAAYKRARKLAWGQAFED